MLDTSQRGLCKEKNSKKVSQQIEKCTSKEKPKKQTRNIMHSEDSNFTLEQQKSFDQLIQIELDLQEEVKMLKKNNKKLMEKLEIAKKIEFLIITQKRDLSAFQNISQDQNSQSQNQPQKQKELSRKPEKIEENQKNCSVKWNKENKGIIKLQSKEKKVQVLNLNELKKFYYYYSNDFAEK